MGSRRAFRLPLYDVLIKKSWFFVMFCCALCGANIGLINGSARVGRY
jgi:hypothetical protein